MKTNKKSIQSFSKYVLFLSLFSILFMYGCQKEKLQEVANETAIESITEAPLAVQKLILEYNFRLQTQGLSDEKILQLYDEHIQLLSEEDRNALTSLFEQLKELNEATTSNNINQAVSTRSDETLLSNGTPDNLFGWSVSTVGNKVYVGASGDQKVYEYSKTGGSYSMTDEITPSGPSDDFGNQVSVSGNWMAVSAPDLGPPYDNIPGQVFMFKKQGGSWVQKSVLTGPASENNFGAYLVLQGNKLAVTSFGSGFPDPGSTISVFEKSGNNWTLSGTIFEPGYTWFSIDMDESGNRIVGTGSVNNSLANVRASIFLNNGSNWVLESEVPIPSPTPFAIAFPYDVAIDNNTVVLTALLPGSKHWVIGNNDGSWEIEQELLLPPSLPFSLCFADIKGSTIIIGRSSNNNVISDAVYVFKKSAGTWNLNETLTLSDNGADGVLRSVAISGNTIVAGIPVAAGLGKAYVFD